MRAQDDVAPKVLKRAPNFSFVRLIDRCLLAWLESIAPALARKVRAHRRKSSPEVSLDEEDGEE